jgi:hypothetical protein
MAQVTSTDDKGWTVPAKKPALVADADGWSVPKKPEPKEPTTFLGRQAAMATEGMEDVAAGMKRALGRDLSPWERTKGAGQAALGAVEYVGSPINAASRTLVGAPVENNLKAAGAPPWLSEMIANTADLGSQVAAGGAVKQLPAMAGAIPGTAQEIMALLRQGAKKAPGAVNKAATTVGGVARSTINAADDLVKSAAEGSQRRAAEKAANAAPTREALTKAKDAAYSEASRLGADVKPEAFGVFADTAPAVLKSNKITSGSVPISEKIYPNTKDLVDRLEDYRGHQLTIDNLQTLQQEASGFVKKALIAAEGDRGAQDVRGAQILASQIRDFIQNLKPEQIVGGADPKAALQALNQAKELARRIFKLDDIETIVDIAKRLKKPEMIQREFQQLAKDDLAMRNFSPAERKLIDEIAADSSVADALDIVPGVGRTVRKGATLLSRSGRFKKAEQLMDIIARGEAAQNDAAAAKAAKPGFADTINDVFLNRPGRGLGPARRP